MRVALAEGNTTGKAVVYVLANNPRLWRIEDNTPEVVLRHARAAVRQAGRLQHVDRRAPTGG